MSDSSDSSEISSVQEDEFLGPAARQDIDIVVIHGDEGKKERPTDLENAQPLQDLLSGRIREIRAKITFEYDVEATFGADKSPGFDEAAVNLLETIWKNNDQYHANITGRSRDSRYTRFIPLVMIAHGLGGRIVQRALFLARRSVKYRSIELRTELLIFVGTPQYSSDYNKFMDDLVWGEVRREFLSFASRYRILSIYQDIEISSSKDIFFLNFPTEKRLTRNTQYTDLGQFSLEDEDLKVLTREITGLLKPSHFDYYYDDYLAVLQSFNKKKFLNIYQNESLAQHRSFNRMAEEYQQFKIWLSEPTSKILLVSGNEGSGKGLASQYLMREAEKHYKKSDIDTLSASFTFSFFDDRYNNLEALFTSLVLQLLLVEPTLFTFLADVEAGSISNMLSDDMNEPAVSRLWRLMKTLLSYRGQCAIVCGINALHDCKSDYTTFLDDLKHFCGISEANFKIVITSVYDGIRLKIPLSIALDHLEMSPTPKSARDTKTSLGAEPAQSIISRTLCRLTDYGQDRSLRMLAWVTYGFRPLELPELATAMALDFVDAQKPDSMDCDQIHGWYSRDISAEIQLSLGDIAEIHGTEVIIANLHLRQAVTEEVRRRANRPDSSSKTKGEKSKATELFKNINHLTITQMCLGYLSVERMERVYEFLRGQHLPHSGPYRDNFCMYAAQYWPAHYVSIQVRTAEVVTTVMQRFESSAWRAAWRKLIDHLGCFGNMAPEIPDFRAPVSFYCASLGFRAALEVALQKEAGMIDGDCKDVILMTATRSGNLATVKYLLSKFDYQQDSISKAIAGSLISGNQAVITELLKRFQWKQGSPVIASLLESAAYMNWSPWLIQTAADQLKQHQRFLTIHLQPALHAAIKVGNKAAAKIILVLKSSVTETNESATDEESRTRSYPSSLLHLAVANGNVDLLSMLASEDLPIDVRDAKNRTPLHLASILSYQDMVRHLISMKIDVNAKDVVGRTALHYAALMGHLEIVKELLLQEDIEIDEKDLEGDTPLSLATKMRQREVVEELLEKKASSKKYNKLGDTALHIAIRNADESIVRLITAAKDVNLEARAKNSFTPLLLAAECGHLIILKHLLSRGAEMNVRAVNDITPLHLAAEKGHVAVAEFLIQNGAEIDYLGNATSRPFHLAAEAGHVALVKMLLQYNACIEGKSRDNRTPLIFASAAGNVETVRCLVNHGAKPNQQDSNDQTALSVAAKRGYRQIIDILLEAAESNKKLKWEQVDLGNALQAAIQWNWLPIVKRLLLVGADIRSKDRDGDSSLCNAMHAKSADMARFLLERGADVNHTNKKGQSALHLAIKKQLDQCVELLVGAGADLNISSYWIGPPLHYAASRGTLKSFSILLDATADIEFRSKIDNTTCMYAVCMGGKNTSILGSEDTVERIKLLEKKGANVKALGGKWGSPLHAAIAMRHRYNDAQSLDVVNYLLSRGASVTDEDEQGRSAIHIAASTKGSLDSFIKILDRDPIGLTRKDTQGRTVWHHAAIAGNLRVLRYISRLICSNGCENEESSAIPKDPRIKDAISQGDRHGWTPLMWSGKQDKHEIVCFLVHHGADVDHISYLGWTMAHVAEYHGQKSLRARLMDKIWAAKWKARWKARTKGHNPGAMTDDDGDSESSSNSDADDGSKWCLSTNCGADIVLVNGKPVGRATRRKSICGGCATVIYGPYWRCKDRNLDFCFKCSWTQHETHPGQTFELDEEYCHDGEMPPAPSTDSAQGVSSFCSH